MSDRFDFTVHTMQDLCHAVQRCGIVPLFQNSIPGFSVEEHVAPEAWFTSEEGVWEWKGPVIRQTGGAYGKFFEKKAAFVRADWYADFVNYRRDGYEFESWYADGLASQTEKTVYELLSENGPVPSKLLKRLGDFRKGGNRGFDAAILRLQTQGYAAITDFMYETDRNGNRYGWGVAIYATPEQQFGEDFLDQVGRRSPQKSYERIAAHIQDLFPNVDMQTIKRFLR